MRGLNGLPGKNGADGVNGERGKKGDLGTCEVALCPRTIDTTSEIDHNVTGKNSANKKPSNSIIGDKRKISAIEIDQGNPIEGITIPIVQSLDDQEGSAIVSQPFYMTEIVESF